MQLIGSFHPIAIVLLLMLLLFRVSAIFASKIARAHRCRNSTPERVSVDSEAR
ncbi:hypothetical protein ASPBRDRAFT_36549 [Aspergillus brasiliensis CBS 101740]|uniref:Copper transporter n=1 Tax=Aspergillus brasiliensis (strain CBS 101740 / IMI 381727 / IBT 21946) TaxID=767769 RepID=A0A1L9V0A3_ASPBC|nr:hypothetical protein ASPBRDRAFT_36549 [Aspergillus brasiliensis CBS 101740]